jgi:hypothetical protein
LPNDTTHYQKENPMNLIELYKEAAESAAASCPEGGRLYAETKWHWLRETVGSAVICWLLFAVMRGAEICGVHSSVIEGAISDSIYKMGPCTENNKYLKTEF